MSDEDRTVLSEEMAVRLWQRAAELQADAARRLEATNRDEAEDELPSGDGYALDHVRAAAIEAGISTEFVDAALTELTVSEFASGSERVLDRPPESLEARRVIARSPEEVYQVMKNLLPGHPYLLSLREARGDLLDGGPMVFDVSGSMGATSYTSFQYECMWADIKQIVVSIHPLAEPDRCEVVARAPMRRGRRLNGALGAVVSGGGAAAGGAGGVGLGMGLGTAIGFGLAWLVPFVVAIALTGAGILGFASRAGYQRLYTYSLGRGVRALETLLSGIDTSATTGWSAATLPPSGNPARLEGGSG